MTECLESANTVKVPDISYHIYCGEMHSVVHPNRRLSSKLGKDPSLSAFYHVCHETCLSLLLISLTTTNPGLCYGPMSHVCPVAAKMCVGDPLSKFTTLTLFLYCLLAVSLTYYYLFLSQFLFHDTFISSLCFSFVKDFQDFSALFGFLWLKLLLAQDLRKLCSVW